ncbi:MAG: UDP-N-acetylglucosamine 2-epimerase (non-hydrolyzing) [Chloroflexi bacterium]|nr:UDP-N-acetylglucosamine 2-epimerase (non-hydrolyzing) [Chloroflexota bacterium]
MIILTVVGARPQFVKAAAVSRVLREKHTEVLVHTGQHYDDGMSKVFFRELDIPEPDYNLEVGSAGHSVQTGEMLIRMEPIFEKEKPDWVLVYGDTNSTLAGALTASKLQIPTAHIEAGLRSFNRAMPEEINRILTDHVSRLLFCPAQKAVENLRLEGVTSGVHVVGDVMYDAVLRYSAVAAERSSILGVLGLTPKQYLLATVHRAANVDDMERLLDILETFSALEETVVFPVHPRTFKRIRAAGFSAGENLKLMEPVGYLDMLWLEKNARMILTDSGGVQKEAYWFGTPCITLREETEWVETVQAGWNLVVGVERGRIVDAVRNFSPPASRPHLFGDGNAAQKIIRHLEDECR